MADVPEDRPALWRKSSYSADSANCVEYAPMPSYVGVRDSKDPDGAILWFRAESWRGFVASIRHGEFDRPAHGVAAR